MGSKAPMNVKSVFPSNRLKASGPALFRNRKDSSDTEHWWANACFKLFTQKARLLIKRSVSKSEYLLWYLLVRKTTWLGLGSCQPKCHGSRLSFEREAPGLRI